MAEESVFILLFVVASAVAILARRLRIPYTVALVLTGLLLGTAHAFEAPHLTKQLLFTVCLPGLLFEAAFHMEFSQFWRNRMATLGLAVPGVAAALALTAGLLAPLIASLDIAGGFAWRHALVLGALLSATDPIAVVGLLNTLGAPRRLGILLEGESLLNDGTAIVLFSLVLTAGLGGAALSARELAVGFVGAVGVGMLVGGAAGLAVSEVMKRVDDPMIEITLTTVAAYGAFVAAEHLHSSGVIATVSAGLLCGNYGARVGMSPSTRVAVETFWEYVAFALNSVVFLLIGFEIHIEALAESWQAIGAAYLAVLLARGMVIAAVSGLLRLTRERIPRAWSVALTWGGLRGALSMVLALSLPREFPYRDLLITMTFGVVLVSLLVQGLTMAPLLRWLGLVRGAEDRAAYELHRGQLLAARSALEELDRIAHATDAAADVLDGLRDDYRRRVAASQRALQALSLDQAAVRLEERAWMRRRLLLVEKHRVLELGHHGAIDQHTGERLLADIDSRLLALESGHPDAAPADDAGGATAADDRRSAPAADQASTRG